MKLSDCYKVGFVMRPHGLAGEVTISIDPEAPVAWEKLKGIMLEKNGHLIPYFIETISIRLDKAFIKFEDVTSPEQAGLLKGSSLYLAKESRPKLPRGEFYNEEVIGFEVIDEVQEFIGRIKDVEQAGANRFLLVDYQQKEVMIPVNGPFIKSINKSKKVVLVNLPEGFLDI